MASWIDHFSSDFRSWWQNIQNTNDNKAVLSAPFRRPLSRGSKQRFLPVLTALRVLRLVEYYNN